MLPIVRRTWSPRGHTPVLYHAGRHRDKVSSMSAITVSPGRKRLRLFIRFYPVRNVTSHEVVLFVQQLLRHLRGPIILVWDRSNTHRGGETKPWLTRHRRRVLVEYFPAYAPELNPDEHIWTHLKYHRLANHGESDVRVLHRKLLYHAARLKQEQALLWSCIRAAKLPFSRR